MGKCHAMKKTMFVAGAFLVFAALFTGAPAYATSFSFGQCPAVGLDSGCQFLITVTSSKGGVATGFTVTESTTVTGPFDGAEDTLVGILNKSGSTVNSIGLTGAGGLNIFHFDGDGACSGDYGTIKGCSGAIDPSGYAPLGVTFSGINGAQTSGTLNFSGGLANGGSNWFSLENALTKSSIIPTVPEPSSLVLLGSGLLGLIGLKNRCWAKSHDKS